MADTKITGLQTPGAFPVVPSTDVLPIVIVADNSMAASGSTRKVTVNQILGAGGTATLASATITGNLTVDTNTLFVDASNNCVGVGTTTPTVYANYKTLALVGGSSGFVIDASATGGGSAGGMQIAATPTGTNFDVFGPNAGTAAPAVIRTGTFGSVSERYRIAGDGVATWSNVGGVAGTAMTLNSTGLGVGASPSYKLDVAGAANSAPITLLRLNNTGTTGGGPGIAARLQFNAGATALGFVQGCNFASGSIGVQISGDGTNIHQTIDTSGNVGIGVTPSAWVSYQKSIDFGGAGNYGSVSARANFAAFATNCYFDGTNWIYKNTNPANLYEQSAGANIWRTAPSGTAGTAITGANAFTQAMTLESTGSLVLGAAAVATTATDGFLYIPGCAGTPTGTPTAKTGRVPLVVDTTNNKLYFYSGGAWVAAN